MGSLALYIRVAIAIRSPVRATTASAIARIAFPAR
jgi:hypothetical protein